MKWISIVFLWVVFLNPLRTIAQKNVMELPECLDNAFIRLNLDEVLSKKYKKIPNSPWVVYSDRGSDYGTKYYVEDETPTQVHIYAADELDGLKMINPVDKGMRNKSDLLMHFSAELLEDKVLHKKCVVLNRKELVDSIAMGLISDSVVPIYSAPNSSILHGQIALYYMYFIYKTENGRYLIGRNYRFQTFGDFNDQVFGWVDAGRVHLYSNRVCFEPNYDKSAIKERRCSEDGSVKVFDDPFLIPKYYDGNTKIEPVWTEPVYYYLTDKDILSDTLKRYVERQRQRLCVMSNTDVGGISSIITQPYLNGAKFRFPLIEVKDNNTFMLGSTGRYEDNDILIGAETCDNLKKNKQDINVFFLLDHTIRDTRSTYALHQIDIQFKTFEKEYGVCFFPRTEIGEYKISLGENKRGKTNYETVRDFIRDYKPTNTPVEDDNSLATLDNILQNEKFDNQKTNIIVILNNSPYSQVSEKITHRIEQNLVKKNCYVILFNYLNNDDLTDQVRKIIINAATSFNSMYKETARPAFINKGASEVLENAGLLAALATRNPTINTASQIENYFLSEYEDIVKTVELAIQIICKNSSSAVSNVREDIFTQSLRGIAKGNITVSTVHALVKGYSSLKVKGCQNEMWKAEILMTDTEMSYMKSLLDAFSNVGNNPWDQAKKICELWKDLCNRFVGDQIDPNALMDMYPEQVLTKLIGNTFGYSNSNALKRFTLRKIESNDPDVQRYFAGYIDHVKRCSARINKIVADGSLRFDLDEKGTNSKEATANNKNQIYYYWIPIDLLP